MPTCWAPGCKSGYTKKSGFNTLIEKRHFFRAPSEPEKLAQWQRRIPRAGILSSKHSLCDLHFEERFICKHFTHTINGQTVLTERGRWVLTGDAEPTVFPNLPSYLSRQTSKARPRKNRCQTNASEASIHLEASKSKVAEKMIRCCVPKCNRNSTQDEGLKFFPFPKDKVVKQKWIKSVGESGWKPLTGSRICSWHFPQGRECWPTRFEWNKNKVADISDPRNQDKDRNVGQPKAGIGLIVGSVYSKNPENLNSIRAKWSKNSVESLDHFSTNTDDLEMSCEYDYADHTQQTTNQIVESVPVSPSDRDVNFVHTIHDQQIGLDPTLNSITVQLEDETDDEETQKDIEGIKPDAGVQHSLILCQSLFHFYERELFCDTIIRTKNKNIKMHGVVLASSSPSLKRRLIKQSSLEGAYTVDLSTFDSEIAETVISYMYLGKLVSKEDWGPDKRLDLKLLMLVLGFTGDEMELFRTQTLSRDILKENLAKPDDSVCNGNEFDVDLQSFPGNLEPGNTNSYKDLCASGQQSQVSQETEEIPMMMSCEDEPNEAAKIQTGYKLPRWNVANETATVLPQQRRKPRPQNTKAKAETSKSRMTVRQKLEILRNLNSTSKAVASPIVLETSLANSVVSKPLDSSILKMHVPPRIPILETNVSKPTVLQTNVSTAHVPKSCIPAATVLKLGSNRPMKSILKSSVLKTAISTKDISSTTILKMIDPGTVLSPMTTILKLASPAMVLSPMTPTVSKKATPVKVSTVDELNSSINMASWLQNFTIVDDPILKLVDPLKVSSSDIVPASTESVSKTTSTPVLAFKSNSSNFVASPAAELKPSKNHIIQIIDDKTLADFKVQQGQDILLIPLESFPAFQENLKKQSQSVLCENCGESISKRYYDKHIKRCGSKASMKCEHCDREFLSSAFLNRHIRLAHSKPESSSCNFVCEICGKNLTTSTQMKKHVAGVHAKERNYVCNLCGKSFVRSEALRRHFSVHSNVYPYKCTKCFKSFKSKTNLYTHQAIHSTFGYECNFCSKRFAYRCNLKAHIRARHNGSSR